MRDEEFNDRLLKKRTILLEGDITAEKCQKVRQLMMELAIQSDKQITLIIDSEGGDIHSALWLLDFIKVLGAPVIGVVNGKCMSAALVILQGCQRRIATIHSEFQCHYITSSFEILIDGRTDKEAMAARLKRAGESQREVERIFCKRTGNPPGKMKKILQKTLVLGLFRCFRHIYCI